MFDAFLHTHNEISLTPGSHRFRPDILGRVQDFLERSELDTSRDRALDRTRHVQTHEAFFQYILDSSFVSFMLSLPKIERRLFEAIILHRLTYAFNHPNVTEFERRSHSVLIVMCKEKLVELLLDLNPDDEKTVFQIGRLSGIRSHIWETACEHAQACVRTIQIFSKIEECWMFFPTVYEKYMLGTDIIVFAENNKHEAEQWCVQVELSENDETEFRVAHIHEEPIGFPTGNWMMRVYKGAIELTSKYPGYVFFPCNITLPTVHSSLLKTEIPILRKFLLKEQRLFANNNAVAA